MNALRPWIVSTYVDSCDIGFYTYDFVSPILGDPTSGAHCPCITIDLSVEFVTSGITSSSSTTFTNIGFWSWHPYLAPTTTRPR